jgi:hypothetical protein
VSELRPGYLVRPLHGSVRGCADYWNVWAEGTFGCSLALTPLVSCSSCSLGTASAAFCSFICGHGACARVGAGQALRVVKLGCRAKERANWVLRLVRRGSNSGWNRLGVRIGLG